MILTELKSWFRALCYAIVGGAIGSAALYGLSRITAWVFFRDLLSDVHFRENLTASAIVGAMAGAATGAGYSLQDGKYYQRKLAGGLCVWIGAMFITFGIVFTLVSLKLLILDGNTLTKTRNRASSADIFSLFLPTAFLYFIPLRLGLRLLELPPWRVVWANVVEAFKAAMLPHYGRDFQEIMMQSPLNQQQLNDRLQEAADIGKSQFSRWKLMFPLREKKAVIAVLKEDSFLLQKSDGGGGYEFRIAVKNTSNGMILMGNSSPRRIVKAFLIYWTVVTSVFTLVGVISVIASIVTLTFKATIIILPITASFFWIYSTAPLRLIQWLGRKQEIFLIDWLCRTCDAEVVESHLRRKKWLLF